MYTSQKSTKQSLDNTNKSSSVVANNKKVEKKIETTKDETDEWLLYESPGKEYKIRLADGWRPQRYLDSESLYAADMDRIQYIKGTQAKVERVEGGRDFSSIAFSLTYGGESNFTPRGTKTLPFSTKQGNKVERYEYTEKTEPEGLGLPKGATEHVYVIRMGTKFVRITHDVLIGERDQLEIVEKVVKTLELN